MGIIYKNNFDDLSDFTLVQSAGSVTSVGKEAQIYKSDNVGGGSWGTTGMYGNTTFTGVAGMKVRWQWRNTEENEAVTTVHDGVYGITKAASISRFSVVGTYIGGGIGTAKLFGWENGGFSSTDTPQPIAKANPGSFNAWQPSRRGVYQVEMVLLASDEWRITVSGPAGAGDGSSTRDSMFGDSIDLTLGTAQAPFIGESMRFVANVFQSDTPNTFNGKDFIDFLEVSTPDTVQSTPNTPFESPGMKLL